MPRTVRLGAIILCVAVWMAVTPLDAGAGYRRLKQQGNVEGGLDPFVYPGFGSCRQRCIATIRVCADTECTGLRGRARRHCKRACARRVHGSCREHGSAACPW